MKVRLSLILGLAVMVLVFSSGLTRAETREYLLGDVDDFVYDGPGSVDDVYVDPDWLVIVENRPGDHHPLRGFDILEDSRDIPFTFVYDLATSEQVIGATLTLILRATSVPQWVETDRIYLESSSQHYDFVDVGWLPISDTGSNIRMLDLSDVLGDDLLPQLQDGILNVCLDDATGVDYATLSIEVIPEPATFSVLALGGLALLRRRRG